MSARRAPALALVVGLLGSQAGHLLAYGIRFGAASTQVQSSGPHGYFPAFAKTGLGLAACLLVVTLLMIGLARVIARGPLVQRQAPAPFLPLLAMLFTVQLASFAAQETAETYLAGAAPTPAPVLLLWGTLGQLPVALLAALAVRWLLTRFAAAVAVIRGLVAPAPAPSQLTPALVAIPLDHVGAALPSTVAGSSIPKRGPPILVRPSPA